MDEGQKFVNQKKKIAIIEDDQMLLKALYDILSINNFDVKFAQDGEAGLKLINEFKPDLILLDINMPVMDGITMLKKIREDASLNNMKVVMLTNYNDDTNISNSMNLNIDRYLVKTNIKLEEVISLCNFLLP